MPGTDFKGTSWERKNYRIEIAGLAETRIFCPTGNGIERTKYFIHRRTFVLPLEKKFWKHFILEGQSILVVKGLEDFFQEKLASFPPFPEVSLSSQWREHVNCVGTWACTTLDTASTYMPYCSPGTCRAKSQLPTWQKNLVAMLMEVKQSEKVPTKSVGLVGIFWWKFLSKLSLLNPKGCPLRNVVWGACKTTVWWNIS